MQAFWSFDLLRADDDKPYIEIGTHKDGKTITYSLDAAQIIPDSAGRSGHFEYRPEIVVT